MLIYTSCAPKPSRKARSPSGASCTARVAGNRRVQPCCMLCSQISAPIMPARCGRRSLQSRQGRQRIRPECLVRRSRIPRTSIPIAARRAMPASVTIPASPAVPHKAVGDGYAELTGQMVVAGPRRRSAASGKSRQLRADRRSRTSGNDVVLPIPCANYAVQILGSLAFLFAAGDNIHLCLCAGRVRAHSRTRPALGARRRPAPHRGCFWPQL